MLAEHAPKRVNALWLSRILLGFIVAGVFSDASAQAVVTYLGKDELREEWRIDKPEVRSERTYYPQIIVRPGDVVRVFAEGCVNTGGIGKTTKDFVNPRGPSADGLYHGTVYVPGVNNNQFQKIRDGMEVKAGEEGAIGIGYMDDAYSDNGYENFDEGNDGQCKNKGSVKVTLSVQRHERWCRHYAFLAAAQNQYRDICGKPNPNQPAWSPDFRVHYQWCLWGQGLNRQAMIDEFNNRSKWLDDQHCPSPGSYEINGPCNIFALVAIGQNWLRAQCGKPVPPGQENRWSTNNDAHNTWCKNQGISEFPRQEEDARTEYLNRQFCIGAPLPIE